MAEEVIVKDLAKMKGESFCTEEICPSSSLEETCTWGLQEKDENTEIKGKFTEVYNKFCNDFTVSEKYLVLIYSKPDVYSILDFSNTIQEIQSERKEETVSIKEESSTVEDTCTVYVQGESMKMESTQLKSRIFFNTLYFLLCLRYLLNKT